MAPCNPCRRGASIWQAQKTLGGGSSGPYGEYKIVICSGWVLKGLRQTRLSSWSWGRLGRGQALCRGLVFVWGWRKVREEGEEGRCKDQADSRWLWDIRVVTEGEEGSSCRSCLWMASTRGRSCCQLALGRRRSYACDTGGTAHAGMPQTRCFPGDQGAPEPTWDVEMLGCLV